MTVNSDVQKIIFPNKERKVQSPYLYLQSVGSTGADGSTYGAHVRWLLLRNLGESHLPKGNAAKTMINFNRNSDVVRLFRSRYITRFPTVVDFSTVPDVVNDAHAFWIYTQTNTATTIYVHFPDAARYAAVRVGLNPATQPLQFMQQYCPGLVEVEMKDKLLFAVEFDVVRDATTVLRAEAMSVETNVPLSPVFVSCRKKFTDRNWCDSGKSGGASALDAGMADESLAEDQSVSPTGKDTPRGGTTSSSTSSETRAVDATATGNLLQKVGSLEKAAESSASIPRTMTATDTTASDLTADSAMVGDRMTVSTANDEVPLCCDGPNLLDNGGFEKTFASFGFETDYLFQGGARIGAAIVTSDASSANPEWEGLPHTGKLFLAVDGSVNRNDAVLRFRLNVELQTNYCFTGWLSTLSKRDPSIELEFRFISANGTGESFIRATPATVRTWEQFSISWNSGDSRTVTVEIVSLSRESIGNDFGIDDLYFCKSKRSQAACRARMRSENIRSIRFDITGGYPLRLELEAYDDYISGAFWSALGDMALTTTDSVAFERLEPTLNSVNGQWRKFNDQSLLNVSNYKDRWTRAGGLRYGVERYIALSDADPMATDTLPGAVQPQDGSIQISMLDALRMVSLDFHVARMLGLGYLDRSITSDTDEYIYLGVYDTDGPLDDTKLARSVRHYYMGVPTKPLDYRLPFAPQLMPVTYGLSVDNGEQQPTYLTDPGGYTSDGLSRYVNLYVEPEVDIVSSDQFFVPPVEFCAIDKTSSVFYGVEYRKQGEATWRRPEIAHDAAYKDLDTPPQFETSPLPNNHDSAKPILRHEEHENGIHEYAGYGINWFSRVSSVGSVVATDATIIKKMNRLQPPSNLAVQLIQKESPLMLTTSAEQDMLAGLTSSDTTLVRVTFDYFYTHDINYDFADTVQLLFRTDMPQNVVGAIKSVTDDPTDSRNVVLRTMGYPVNSQGTMLAPTLAPALYSKFIGGVVSCQRDNYIITHISQSAVLGEGPIFTVRKNIRGKAVDPDLTGSFVTVQEYIQPQLDPSLSSPVMFMAVENMAESDSWGTPNPLSSNVTIGDDTWTTHQETYVQDGESVTVNLRGVVSSAIVTQPSQIHPEVYRIEFQTYLLPHHPQYADIDPVEWYKGAVRVARVGDPNGPKHVLEVLLVENLGRSQPLVLHVMDNAYDPNDPGSQVITNVPVTVNYYPGYKIYLHGDTSHNFTSSTILPAAGEGSRKTWLGARSYDSIQQYYSPVGIPAPIVAFEFIEPLPPEKPSGSEFATRPDFYFKSSYTFRMNFAHRPFAVAMYRANDEAILRALYNDDTYMAVRQQLELMGEADLFSADRWKNLLSFDYVYDEQQGHLYYDPTGSNVNNSFRKFPNEDGYAFPNPDRGGPLNGSEPGNVLTALKNAVYSAFTPLTEMPLIYDYISGPSYVPSPKSQHIRNGQGTLLTPTDPEFDMAPMAKKTGNGFEIQFTDFTLDGSGNNIFFYFGREIGNRGRLGEPGPISGPVRLINSRPPESPGIKKMYMQERNVSDDIGPAIHFEVNTYPAVQNVKRMLIYRATDATAALSIRTMDLVKTVDFADAGQLNSPRILLADDFENGVVPYGDMLFYRIIALRKIKNSEDDTEWVPSQPSKLLLTTVVDSVAPEAPEISVTSDGLSGTPAVLSGVVLSWPTTTYNGTYYLEMMNSVGKWVTIHRIKTNAPVVVSLAATALGTDILPKESNDDAQPIYNRFRVRVENSSGLFNLSDNVLTI